MELEEYIKAIEQCPDELIPEKGWRLTRELRIYDNWPILFKTDYSQLVKDLVESTEHKGLFNGEYILAGGGIPSFAEEHTNNHFEYVPGTVVLQVGNWLFGCNLSNDRPDLVHRKRQEETYNVSMLLHPYQKHKIPGINWTRAIANVVIDIGKYAQRKNISLCFTCSRGWDNPDDSSKIVYFDAK